MDQPPMPSADLGSVFDRDQQVFMSNRATLPPRNYKQSQILAASAHRAQVDTIDFYSDGRLYQMQPRNIPTLPHHVIADALMLVGAELTGDFVSELAKVTRNTSHAIIHWFFSWGGALNAPLSLPRLDGKGCALLEQPGFVVFGNY